VYRASEVPTTASAGGATVVQYRRPASGCLAYLVSDGDRAAVVDPLRAFADRYVADCEERGWTLVAAVDTHVHADHVSGVRAVADRTDAGVVVPAGARERGLSYDRPVRFVADGDGIAVGETAIDAVSLPGHTTETTGFRVDDLLLAGDSLFLRAVARPDLEGAAAGDERADGSDGHAGERDAADRARDLAATLYHTLHGHVLSFPDDTRLCPGHYEPGTSPEEDGTYTATLGTPRDRVAALALDEDEFVDCVAGAATPRPANFEDIVATNLGRASTDDETAFELELGPNNCAAPPN
jgi:glyoxylase-like metal-dependent hydrolase (beta-lactamase superfamily II)